MADGQSGRRRAGKAKGAGAGRAGAAPAMLRALARVVADAPLGSGEENGVDSLIAEGWAVRDVEGRPVATAAGRARLARETGGVEGFRAQHLTLGRRFVEIDGVAREVDVDLDESPLAWLARRKGRDGRPLISASETLAGERLRADFTRGQMTPRVTANWEASIASGRRGGAGVGVDLAESVVAARGRVSKALAGVGPELSGVLVDVCCLLKGIEAVERERGWPARGGKLALGFALKALARHYGYAEAAEGPARDGKVAAWRGEGARPTLDGAAEGS
ncbi:DUF6456 domain-containing protein [Methylopila sp. 73B]|uniref:DUF6456 domain-containing protein n=1 Tax=Methylopila sp. 73B TaxID=1120792 RepID=UPI003204E1C7